MRPLLLVSLSLVAALTTARDAEACGGYIPEPQVLQVSSHRILGRGEQHTRTFVVLPWDVVPERLTWDQLSPQSFDSTQFARARPLAKPMTLTLLGPSGTRVVTESRRVYLDRSWKFLGKVGAIEVDVKGRFRIALEGAHVKARWLALEPQAPTPELTAWLSKQAPAHREVDGIQVRRIAGTTTDVVELYSRTEQRSVTLLKDGNRNAGELASMPIGAFANNGAIQLVLANGAATSQVYVGASL